MINYTEIITKYINGELSPADRAAFEKELSVNSGLKKEYELQLKLVEGIKRMGLKNQLRKSFKTVKTKKLIIKAVVGVIITIAAIGAVVWIKNTVGKTSGEVLYELNEEGKANWSEADKQLESQLFEINPLQDTIIETKSGIVFSIPAHAFLNKMGDEPQETIDLEIKEAMTPSDIIKAGLSTMSNGKQLETGGMFYLNARIGNENLVINKRNPVSASVPANTGKKDMLLFRGERKADGSINWIDPKPMVKRLTTVDITQLNFYPEHFLDSLQQMGFNIKNKKLTDSIYYSYSGNCHFEMYSPKRLGATKGIAKYSFDEAVSATKDTLQKSVNEVSGETLFKQNCSVCHSMGAQKLTGPGMEGLLQRIPKGDWLEKWILNNEKLIKSGDAYANKIYNENGKAAMTVFDFNEQELKTLIEYITHTETWNIDKKYDGCEGCDEIDPSRIKAIWDKKFSNTILATKEFEERLKLIFKTCNSAILNLYVKNLNKNLYEIDSIAATLTSGELKNKFMEFAARRDGGVAITDEKSQRLHEYFEQQRLIYANSVNKALQKMYEKESAQNTEALSRKNAQALEEGIRASKVFAEELEMNMDEAYRQLGKKRPQASPAGTYLTADVTQTGWNNVDRYVIESTTNRSTLNYTDPQSGKKAIIRYNPVSVSVNNYTDYDRVVCYMIPDKLSSFQLMKHTGNVFKESLNELMNYSIITVGFKGKKWFYNEIKPAKAQLYNVDLALIKASELDKKLDPGFTLNQKADILKNINYQLFDIKENARQAQIKKREDIRNRIYPIVFPCAGSRANADTILDLDFE